MQALREFAEAATPKRAFFSAVSFTSLFSPGFVALYRFKPHEFQTWEAWKILAFCGVIGVPSVICCALLFFLDGEGEELKSEKKSQALFVAGATFSTFLLHLVHVALLPVPNATFKSFVYGVIAIHVALTFVALLVIVPSHIARARKKKREAATFTPEI